MCVVFFKLAKNKVVKVACDVLQKYLVSNNSFGTSDKVVAKGQESKTFRQSREYVKVYFECVNFAEDQQ